MFKRWLLNFNPKNEVSKNTWDETDGSEVLSRLYPTKHLITLVQFNLTVTEIISA